MAPPERLNSSIIFFLFSCLIFLMKSDVAYAGEEFKGLTIYTENDPPYVIVDAKGKIGGLATNKLNYFLKAIQLSEENIEVKPWVRSYIEVLNKPNIMIYPIAKTPERLEKLEYIYKIYDAIVFFYKLSSRKDIVISNINEAKKYSVCAVRADYRAEYLKRSGFPMIDESNDSTMNFKKFIAGRCDVAILTEIGLNAKLEQLNLDSSLVSIAYPLSEIDSNLYIAINKNTNKKVIDALKNAAKKLE
ncbi:substrate-binding periplasmic protein [Iodobacter fluviatilis]|uniref:Bacterial extracellular solute-binding proteins, family 3 n=1 Tax=Iodobacter fluviatilis TaxID=537 RepID=A0A377SUJ5_9NEIS|nr:transporter substrate-binding domain-containing protein [Iodobacter fluviatilis]TCU88210.1 extracellular solute-binding protein (family 3) [Iodobacter fluviatilis]STR45711.1 Bacterial extracellular solute-binding proteins, family 3 [Iodobacter fluviatilis]